jgi:serine/threonine protein kinase
VISSEAEARRGPELPGLTCIQFIDSGGFADVFLYERHQPRGRVAVKLMRLDAVDDSLRRQFSAEADAMAELAEHPNIATVFGAGTAPDGRPYLVMQFYPRADLEDRVAQAPLSVQEALRLGIQLSSAVETAHRAGIIHRDIKPSNILMTSFGQPVLSDFGIAGRPSDVEETDVDVGVSIPWSSPEVLTGGSNGSVFSDVYSLAATMWHLLVGRAPFFLPGGDNGERATVTRIVHSRPPVTGRDDVPASLDRLLQQAMAKDPAHRPQTALELARHFQRVEQELRLARTETAVLDHESEPPVAPPRAPARDDPTTAAPASPAVPDLTVPDPAVPDSAAPDTGVTMVGTTPTDLSPQPADQAPTERKPPRRVAAAQSRSDDPARRWHSPPTPESRRSDISDAEQDRRTERRPRVAASVQTTAPAAEHPADALSVQRPSRRLLLAAAGLVAVAAIGVGVFLTHGGSHDPQAGHHTTRQPVDTDLGDTVPAGGLTNPRATGHAQGHRVRFIWRRVAGAQSYTYTTNTGRSGTTRRLHTVVDKATSGRTCITVASEAPGVPSSTGRTSCFP